MNRLITLMFLVVISCPSYGIAITEVDGRFECPDLRNAQKCAKKYEARFKADNPSLIRREGDELVIKLNDGRHYEIKDENHRINVLELADNHQYLVLREQYWEGNTWHLLNLNTGLMLETEGYPLFSPDGQWVVVSQMDLLAGYSPNVLRIYKNIAGMPLVVFDAHAFGKDWGPTDVRWEGNSMVRFDYVTLSDDYRPGQSDSLYERFPARLKLRDGEWHLLLNNRINSGQQFRCAPLLSGYAVR
jgi:hypothetical protein